MINLTDIWEKVEESSHETAFNYGEVEGLFNLLSSLQDRSTVLEIGVQFGRSTTVFAEVAKDKSFDLTAVDNWGEANGEEAHSHILSQVKKYNWKFTLLSVDSADAGEILRGKTFNLIHIDGDHSYAGVTADCKTWLPRIKKGGYACFDDYGHAGLEGVKKAVDEYIDDKWENIALYGNKLQVFKKIK